MISFEALLFTIAIASILLAMAKERTELRHRTAAMTDPLTGIANRRSFMQDTNLLAKRYATNPRPTAVLLLDLDHFKSITIASGTWPSAFVRIPPRRRTRSITGRSARR